MGASATPGDRAALARAMELIGTYSLQITQIAATSLGERAIYNRDIRMLLNIHANPGVVPSAVADGLALHRSAVSRTLRRLRSDRLVADEIDPRDRRVVHLVLTDRGRTVIGVFLDRLTAFCVASAPLAREVSALLAPHAGPVTHPIGPDPDPFGLVELLSETGSEYLDLVDRLAPVPGLDPRYDRIALSTVADRGEARPMDLYDVLGLSSGATTTVLDRLERAGLISRRRRGSAGDRRAVVVECTPEGLRVALAHLDALAQCAPSMARVFGLSARIAAAAGAA